MFSQQSSTLISKVCVPNFLRNRCRGKAYNLRQLTEQFVQRAIEGVRLTRLDKVPGVLLNLSQVSDEVSFVRLDSLSLLEEFPAEVEGRENENLETLVSYM